MADLESLREGAQRLTPALIVLDLSLAGRGFMPAIHAILHGKEYISPDFDLTAGAA